ncbi:hypothetical protein GCK32_016126, partial [Trichostrongylus colubriformis]
DSNEAAERLAKLSDIDAVADEKIEDLRKRLSLLEYQRWEQEPLLYRVCRYIRAILNWIMLTVNHFLRFCRAIANSAYKHQASPPPAVTNNSSETSVSPVMSPPSRKRDETDVSLRHRRALATAAQK